MTIFRGKRKKEWRLSRRRKYSQNKTTRLKINERESKKHKVRQSTPAKTNKRKHIQGSSSKKQIKHSRLNAMFSPLKHSTPKKASKRILNFSLGVNSFSDEEDIENNTTFLYSLDELFTDSNAADIEDLISLRSEHEGEYIKNDIPYDSANENKTISDLFNEALPILKKHDKSNDLIAFFKLVAQGRFPLDNVAFMLFLDVIKWFNSDDVRQIRYNDTTLKFFWLGKKLFGGRFLRFMSGPKNEADGVLGKTNFSPMDSKINFACPSDSRLTNYNPLGYDVDVEAGPGIVKHMIDLAAKNNRNEKSYVIMFDGKKIKRGADMDLLGFEKEPVAQKRERLKKDLDIIDDTFDQLQVIDDLNEGYGKINETIKLKLRDKIRASFKTISIYIMQMRKLKQSKILTLKKYKERIQKDASLARTLQYAMDACRTSTYQIDNCVEVFMNVQWELCKAGAYLNGVSHLFAKSKNVSVEKQLNVKLLKDVADMKLLLTTDVVPTNLIKQRSEEWHAARKTVKITGSSIYTAIGCDGLKRQNEHFDSVFSNVVKPEPDENQRKAMEHGVQSEPHQIATLSSVVIPFLFPDMSYVEEGYYKVDDVIVSPDGSLRDSSGSQVSYAFEGKAPIPKEFSTRQHYTVPLRYITQTIYEHKATNSDNGTLYMCWTPESTTLFTVPKNNELYEMIRSVIKHLYGEDIPRRKTRLSIKTKELKEKLQECVKQCVFLGEFPSVKAYTNSSANEEPEDINVTFEYKSLSRLLLKAKTSIREAYNLQRNYASQVVVYLLADLDRLWKSEIPHAIPVMYYYRGYSLSMEQARELLDFCRNACRKEGLDVIATASDGEFKQLMVVGKNGAPLTLYQLSKVVWHEICNMKKSQLINLLSTVNCKYTVEIDADHKISLTSKDCGSSIRTPPKGWKKKNMSKKEQISQPIIEPNVSDINNAFVELDTVNNVTKDKDLHSDPDKTVLYDFEELLQEQEFNGDSEAFPRKLNNDEKKDILHLIHQRRPNKWKDTSINELTYILENKLKVLIVDELQEISKYLNLKLRGTKLQMKVRNIKKDELVEQLSKTIKGTVNAQPTVKAKPPPKKIKVRNPQTLHDMAIAALRNPSYPKQALNIAYARFIWPKRVEEWRRNSRVSKTVIVKGNSEELFFEPYYVPEFNEEEEDFQVFIYDRTHLGTNLRKCLCLDKVDGISIRAWKTVADRKPNILHPTIVEITEDGKILDQMKEKLARSMVTEEVEQEMEVQGYFAEAEFCNVIRNGLYIADDVPGIDAMDRCKKRLKLIEWLDKDIDFGRFPPYGGRIKGLSHILYEGLRTSQEGKLYLYALAKSGKYCVRAANTLCSESFFGSMQEMDPWGQGILSSSGVQKHISDFTTITALKMETSRNMFIKTKKDTVYPSAQVNYGEDKEMNSEDDQSTKECSCRKDKYISCIVPRNHFFDSSERARVYKGEKLYKPGTGELKGEQPIRAQYGYKINEAKMLPSQRLGISKTVYQNKY